jgi:putative redox protein
MDIPADQGGHGNGVRPMQALLSALGGCSGVDVVMILNKQKETIEHYEMEISGERALGKEPALWETVHVVFKLKGSMTKEKAEKACALSIDKYCSVAATLRAAGAVITWEVVIL